MFLFCWNLAIHYVFIFFFNDTATTEIYTLSLHDALPIWIVLVFSHAVLGAQRWINLGFFQFQPSEFAKLILIIVLAKFLDRKSTRLNSSHQIISYAVFCLKKKTKPER